MERGGRDGERRERWREGDGSKWKSANLNYSMPIYTYVFTQHGLSFSPLSSLPSFPSPSYRHGAKITVYTKCIPVYGVFYYCM